jgi:hypothetical protein
VDEVVTPKREPFCYIKDSCCLFVAVESNVG